VTKKRKKKRAYTRKLNSTVKIYTVYVYACICFPAAPAFSKYMHSLPYTSYTHYSPGKKMVPSHPGGKKQTHDQIYSKRTFMISS
jgi:hypothetical protein